MNMQFPPQLEEAQVHRDPVQPARQTFLKSPAGRWVLALLGLAAVALMVWLLVMKAQSRGPVAPPAGPPAVSVMVPGLVEVPEVVQATGTISARRDMPVGVVGEGGAVETIRAEAGQYVQKGQVLAEIDSAVQRAQLQQLRAGAEQARADARLARAELERAQKLVERGFVSRADIDRRQATLDAAEARVAVADAQVREMQERIGRLSIRAPEAGLVLERSVEPGQVVSPATGPLFRIAAGGALELRAEVAEQDMTALRVGEAVTVTPSGADRSVTGTIWLVEPVIDPARRLGVARISLPADPMLRVGGFARADIVGGTLMRPRVPQSAVLSDNEGSFVYVVGKDDKVVRRPVKIGPVSREGIAIREGLDGSERVVVSAGAFLRAGEVVTPVLRKD
ncbi:efflux RND transporter periplasmic adaptor subunit [Thermaurantiacus sp.]